MTTERDKKPGEVRAVPTSEAEELASLLRRAVGVISDIERTRTEAAAVLDAFARLGLVEP